MKSLSWLKSIDPVVDEVQNAPWDDAEFYRQFVAQIYHFVRQSTRMLAAAAAVTESPAYYQRLIEHLKEESGHEKLALSDLKQMGGEIADYPEMGVTRALWEPQFFKIQRGPSTALLGYIIALEIVAVRAYPALIPQLEQRHGKKAVHFIRVHGLEDPDHVEKASEQISMLPADERAAVVANFEQTCAMLRHFMTDVRDSSVQHSTMSRKLSQAA